MTLIKSLQERSDNKCELCAAAENLNVYTVLPQTMENIDHSVLICAMCCSQVDNADQIEENHWRCLNDSMWSQVPAVQVLAWRMLNRLKPFGWSGDLLDMLFLDEETERWARDTPEANDEAIVKHVDSNGVELKAGDSVVLIKDLNVKGANFTAKRGQAVRRISLVHDNPNHIEGRVNDQHIVILTQYVKKSK